MGSHMDDIGNTQTSGFIPFMISLYIVANRYCIHSIKQNDMVFKQAIVVMFIGQRLQATACIGQIKTTKNARYVTQR